MRGKHRILFYTKPGCYLCDEARDILHHLAKGFSLTIEEIDILTDSALYERYKNIIPVVIVDGQLTLGPRLEEDELCQYLRDGAGKNRE